MKSNLPETISGADLGAMFGLFERSIREHRAKGNVFRRGNAYDYLRSVRGMVDYHRVEVAKKGIGDPGQTLWETYADTLRYRSRAVDGRDLLNDALKAIMALPDLPDTARDRGHRARQPHLRRRGRRGWER